MKEEQVEIMNFNDEMPEAPVDYASLLDKTIDEDEDGTGHLANFLQRPVLIDTFTWTQAAMTNPLTTFYPWDLFLNDTKIRAKVQNFSRYHGKLHLKFVLNASPFYYGAIRVCYFPSRSNVLVPGTSDPYELVPCSQTPGVWLTPQDMSSAEIILPFLSPMNWLNPGYHADEINMGQIRFYIYAQLDSANAVTTSAITISTYAWAEESVLAGPTSLVTVTSQPVKEGRISGLADKVATIAGKMSSIPVIGSYATAASMAAGTIGKVAAMFGFSNAPIVDDVKPMQPKCFHAFANCETSVPIDKLCVDPSNEVLVDNRVAGTDSTDPLAFANFLRESYVGQFTWATSDAAEANLQTLGVSPCSDMKTVTNVHQSVVYHTPLSYAGRMFGLWRGGLIFRFKIIKSKYHKGRLRISWDPFADLTAVADSETSCFTRVVDLETDDEVEFEVPYKAVSIWLTTSFLTVPMWTTSNASATQKNCNGFLSLKVQNTLSAPVDTSTITILAFIRPASDFQFAQPNDLPARFSRVAVTSAPVVDNESSKNGKFLTDITVGEAICSLRPLLHRATFSFSQVLGFPYANSTPSYWNKGTLLTCNILPRTPPWYGGIGNNAGTMGYGHGPIGTGLLKANFCETHPMNWILSCFAGYKGSVVVHVDVCGTPDFPRIEHASLSRYPAVMLINEGKTILNGITTHLSNVLMSNYSTTPLAYNGTTLIVPTGQRGMTLTKEITQSALSAVSPQYAPVRYAIKLATNCDSEFTTSTSFPYWQDNFRLDTLMSTSVDGAEGAALPSYSVYYAGGVDMQPVFFVCTPVLYEWKDVLVADSSYAPS
jgi:hypothetical protein